MCSVVGVVFLYDIAWPHKAHAVTGPDQIKEFDQPAFSPRINPLHLCCSGWLKRRDYARNTPSKLEEIRTIFWKASYCPLKWESYSKYMYKNYLRFCVRVFINFLKLIKYKVIAHYKYLILPGTHNAQQIWNAQQFNSYSWNHSRNCCFPPGESSFESSANFLKQRRKE